MEVTCPSCTLKNNADRETCLLCLTPLPSSTSSTTTANSIRTSSSKDQGNREPRSMDHQGNREPRSMDHQGNREPRSMDHQCSCCRSHLSSQNGRQDDGGHQITNAPVVIDHVFCPYCGVKNASFRTNCVACSGALRNAVDQLVTDLSKSTNNFFRDVGLNIDVVCPSCGIVVEVPPLSIVNCSACGASYRSSTIGDSATFHLNELGRSLSGSISALISDTSRSRRSRTAITPPPTRPSAPVGVLLQAPPRETTLHPETPSSTLNSKSTSSESTSSESLKASKTKVVPTCLNCSSMDAATQVDSSFCDRGTQVTNVSGTVVNVEGDVVQL